MMTTTWYPQHQQSKIEDVYFAALKKFPYDRSIMKRILRLAIKPTKDGYKTISIYDVPDGKLTEAMNRQAAFMHEYHNIIGHRFEIETYFSMAEAFKIIGKAVPED